MTGLFYLDWAILAVSLFNAILLLWLGLAVLLNAERRSWGIALASGGLLLGAVFFISHSAILGNGPAPVAPGLNFWWRVGWLPVAALPYAWYVVMLWYAGFWERQPDGQPVLPARLQRHRLWFPVLSALGLALVTLLLLANPLPSFDQLVHYDLTATPSVAGIPVLILIYPVYTLACILFSLDALRHPGPSGRWMGERARSRALRWLSGAALSLLVVSLLVGWVMLWVVIRARGDVFSPGVARTIGLFDLVIESFIALSVLLLGQAVVAYEVFTGKTLPRRGLAQYWRRAVILAAGFAVLAAWALTIQLRPIYSLLLSAVLVAVFYALIAWRAYAERERFMAGLRPFVASQNLYANILEPENGPAAGYETFRALCAEVLEARQAILAPLGSLSVFSAPPLVFPPQLEAGVLPSQRLAQLARQSTQIAIPIDPEQNGGMVMLVPLWDARGQTGLLLLGEKRSGSPYTQEEIEIAQAAGERLIDNRAGAEMARRLVALQRQRLAHTQVLDWNARRVLHDDVLPLVHAALLELGSLPGQTTSAQAGTAGLLADIHRRLSDLLRALPSSTSPEITKLGFVGALRQAIAREAEGAFDAVEWRIDPQAQVTASNLPAFAAETLFFAAREAVRNAARHGSPANRTEDFCLSISLTTGKTLCLSIKDNGVGFQAGKPENPPQVETGGSGQGLSLHSTLMAVIGGSLLVESEPGQYTRVVLELPPDGWD